MYLDTGLQSGVYTVGMIILQLLEACPTVVQERRSLAVHHLPRSSRRPYHRDARPVFHHLSLHISTCTSTPAADSRFHPSSKRASPAHLPRFSPHPSPASDRTAPNPAHWPQCARRSPRHLHPAGRAHRLRKLAQQTR